MDEEVGVRGASCSRTFSRLRTSGHQTQDLSAGPNPPLFALDLNTPLPLCLTVPLLLLLLLGPGLLGLGDGLEVLGRPVEGHVVLPQADLQVLVQAVPNGRAPLLGLDPRLVPHRLEVGRGVRQGEAACHAIEADAERVEQVAGRAHVRRLGRHVLRHVVEELALVAVVTRPVFLYTVCDKCVWDVRDMQCVSGTDNVSDTVRYALRHLTSFECPHFNPVG